MPSGGISFAAPPVRVWHATTRAELAELLHGCNFYSMGAGGFGKVPALPNMVRLRSGANPHRPNALRASQFYVTQPVSRKQRLESQFGKV